MMYGWKGEVPEEEYLIPFGQADIKRAGRDVTIITYSKPLKVVMEAVKELESLGIDPEVIDLRSIRPLDEAAIYESVRKTNRCVIVEESWPFASVGSHVAWLISKNCFDTEDHCNCTNRSCKYHGKCLECVAIHRAHQDHLPFCMQDMLNQKIRDLSALTEDTAF